MIEALFSEDGRRNPYPIYCEYRSQRVLHMEPSDLWMIFGYEDVRTALEDHTTFSSAATPSNSMGDPLDWLIFKDPPRHSRLRGLIACAFTPRVIANLEHRIQQISQQLLEASVFCGEMDLATDYSIQLPLQVIAGMLGIPASAYPRFRRWSDAILNLAETVTGSAEATRSVHEYQAATAEMDEYLKQVLQSRDQPWDNLLFKLADAELGGERLEHTEILGFFQLLLLAGSETTTNLINNAMLCFIEHPSQFDLLRQQPHLLATAIEEALRYPCSGLWPRWLRSSW